MMFILILLFLYSGFLSSPGSSQAISSRSPKEDDSCDQTPLGRLLSQSAWASSPRPYLCPSPCVCPASCPIRWQQKLKLWSIHSSTNPYPAIPSSLPSNSWSPPSGPTQPHHRTTLPAALTSAHSHPESLKQSRPSPAQPRRIPASSLTSLWITSRLSRWGSRRGAILTSCHYRTFATVSVLVLFIP